jgi:hypothetical protein
MQMELLVRAVSSAWSGFTRRLGAGLAPLVIAALLATAGSLGVPSPAHAQLNQRPCDIYQNYGTPCVAAHSTTRALFASYNGRLYQVQRKSDGKTQDIGLISPGGYANAALQDAFCAGTSCIITIIYDQSSRQNDLTVEGAGTQGAADAGAPANALPIMAGGHQVYGVSISAGMGYRNDHTTGIAMNGQPEGMYMVTSGTHVNNRCCFDYGNAEVSNSDTGNGHMDAINFGTECWFQPCYGDGPWVQADMENGLFQSSSGFSLNENNTGNPTPFVTAMLKNNGNSRMAIKSDDAQIGPLTTQFVGGEPVNNGPGYSPIQQEGAIVLGTGGDNSNGSIGSFFEGVMTAGYPADAADNAVQANIVDIFYGGPTGIAGKLQPGSEISLRATSPCCGQDYLRHQTGSVILQPVQSQADALNSNFIIRPGLADNTCVSFEAQEAPGEFLRHFNFVLYSQPYDGNPQFAADATFCPTAAPYGEATFRSFNFPDRYLRHYNFGVFIASNGGPRPQDNPATWAQDTTWKIARPLEPEADIAQDRTRWNR